MANICRFKFKAKGPKNKCYALYGGQASYEKTIIKESGTEIKHEIVVEGFCKWDIDYWCKDLTEEELKSMVVPEDYQDAFE